MEKYEDHYARIPVEFSDAIELALNYPEKRLDGIVVNAFTTPVELGVEQLRKISRSWR